MSDSTAYVVKDDILAAYGAALASLVGLMLNRVAKEKPGISQQAAVAYRKGNVRLQLVTTLSYGTAHELVLSAVDQRGNQDTLATVVVDATVPE